MKVDKLKGIGPKKKELLEKLSINTSRDLLDYFPRGYEDRSTLYTLNQVEEGRSYLLRLKIIDGGNLRFMGGRKSILTFKASDDTGFCQIVWFNQHYLKSKIKIGEVYYFYGRVSKKNNRIDLQSPIISKTLKKELGKLTAVYPLSKGLTQKDFRSMIDQVLEIERVENIIPEEIRLRENLLDRKHAYREIHCPSSVQYQRAAKKTLIFEELLIVQLAMKILKGRKKREGFSFRYDEKIQRLIESLDFPLTNAQERVLREIIGDMKKPISMNRLVQGDVGSGKTIIAVLAIYLCFLNGKQSAFMAPTEILASQHYESVQEILNPFGVRTGLLVGSLKKKEKEEIIQRLKEGEIDLIIGTHAVLEDYVEFQELGLVITDEQHRFGVKQRAVLTNKGESPDTLVMTATPIPRTLSLVFYGDLDVSSIDELPPGRIPIKTYAVPIRLEERIMNFVIENLQGGKQAYIICPLVENNEDLHLKSIEKMETYLKKRYFKNFSLAGMHGRMKAEEKNRIMEDFANNDIQLLLATTVIEVGINVPNAAIMVIYNAERFGLSQLHQLRGRVGRGTSESYCILIHEGKSMISRERMRIMQQTTDGFLLSEKDLELRGEGDLLGTNQSGLPQFRIADPFQEGDTVRKISELCSAIIEKDLLKTEEFKNLYLEIEEFLNKLTENIIFN
ncbi:MAG: ATP-dependent DNA helicase RecG [Gallicola sp.]|nr:ATP-dependent DNA helicase RecG [Gallicola sp.]